ncbi:hypothetical protein RIF29_37925 [Crotalaria pallida]|uniref:Uncharacterized protein n=1 Tax=Crotalaria pallida TaxID=3830 RepID=A0AAN9HRU8_CROPI
MGNNNTAAVKEDNTSEAEKKTLLKDTSELANDISQDVDAGDVKEENRPIRASIAKDVMEKAAEASNDAKNEPDKDTWQEDNHGKIQMISTGDSKDIEENVTLFAPKNTTIMHSLEGDTQASDESMENETNATSESEHVQEKRVPLASDCSAIEHGKVTLQDDTYADDVKEHIHMIPTAEEKDVQEKATRLTSNDTASMVENDSLEGDSNAGDVNMENQIHPAAEAEDEDVHEKPAGLASEYYSISSLETDSLKEDAHADDVNGDPTAEGTDDQEIASELGFNDQTKERQENKHDADVVIPLAFDDPLNLRDSFGGTEHHITEAIRPKKFTNAGPIEVDDENHESLSSYSSEGIEEFENKTESSLRMTANNHHLDDDSSIKQDNEETTVLTLNAVDVSKDSELQESTIVHSDHDELVHVLFDQSHQGSESLIKDNFIDTNSHVEQINGVLEKEMESQEKMLCAEESASTDRNELESGFIQTSGITSYSPSVGNNSNGNILTELNYITEDSLISLPESSFVMDNPLKSDHEEKVLCEGSTMESYNSNLDHCKEETLEEFEAGNGMVNAYVATIESSGDYNGESNTILDSDVSWIANTDQVEETKVTENGKFDACVNNCEASDETNFVFVSEQKHSVVSEAEFVCLIAGSNVVDCRNENEDNYKFKMEETNEKLEASYANVETSEGTEMSEQYNSDLVTINQEKSFTLQQNSCSSLHIYDCHQGYVKHEKSFTANSMLDSDWKQTNDTIDSSKLTVPSLYLVDDEAFERELEIYPRHIEATSLKGKELTTSTATVSSEVLCSNNSMFDSGGYEPRDSVTRLSTESEYIDPNISSKMQKSPSFNLNLRTEARTTEESDQATLLYQDKLANERMSNQASLTVDAEYGQCMLQNEEMPVEEKIVTMERSSSEKFKAPFLGLFKEEEAHLLVKQQTQDSHSGTKKDLKGVSSTPPKGKEMRKPRSSFFSSCMCCATVAN